MHRSSGHQNRADAGEQDVGAVSVGAQTELAPEAAQPEDGLLRPSVGDVVDKQGGEQDEHKDAAHAFDGLAAHVFDIEALFLVEAVGVFDMWAAAPLGVHLLRHFRGDQRDVGEQDNLAPVVRGVSDQRPESLLGGGQPQRQPTELTVTRRVLWACWKVTSRRTPNVRTRPVRSDVGPFPALEGCCYRLPPVDPRACSEDELPVDPCHLGEDLLVIQA